MRGSCLRGKCVFDLQGPVLYSRGMEGEKANRVFVQSAITCCLCGYEFPTSGVFLVFAYGPDTDGYYKATSCPRPRKRDEANEDIAILNELVDESRTSRSTRSRAKTRAPGNGGVRHIGGKSVCATLPGR